MSSNYKPYDPNVPQRAAESLADSQPEFLTNFFQLYQKFMVNHVPLDAGSTAGNHTIVELLEQTQPLQTGTSEISVYTKDVIGQTDQIFIRYQGNGQEIQYTNYQIYSVEEQNGQIPYFTFLPGSILLYFGSFTTLPNNVLNLYPPIAKNIITISLCPNQGSATAKPKVSKIVEEKGFYKEIQLKRATAAPATIPPCFYMVMANV